MSGPRLAALGLFLLVLPAVVHADAPPEQYEPYLSSDEFVDDRATKFRWQRKASDTPVPLAQAACSIALYKVPTVRELATLIDNQPRTVLVGPTSKLLHIDQNAFPRTPPAPFWTSSRAPDGRVFVVDFGTGAISLQAPTATAHVRCLQRN